MFPDGTQLVRLAVQRAIVADPPPRGTNNIVQTLSKSETMADSSPLSARMYG